MVQAIGDMQWIFFTVLAALSVVLAVILYRSKETYGNDKDGDGDEER